jgi:transposase-like protein
MINGCSIRKLLGFFVKGHKGDDIGKNVLRYMAEWGLERVMTITIDNASANDAGIGYF